MTVLVTGASGFIGRALCQALVEHSQRVRAAVRDPSNCGELAQTVERVAVGNIGPDTDWSSALRGVDFVVHLAARAHVDANLGEGASAIDAINHLATAALGQRAAAAGVRRFIFVSSIKVNGEMTAARPFTESDTPAPADAYGKAKWNAEQALLRIEGAMERVILRPPLVHGPGVKGNLLRMMSAIARGVPMPLASITNRRSLLGLDNLISAIELCMTHPAAAGHTYLLSDGRDVSTPQLIRLIAQAMNRRARLLPFPVSLLKLTAGLLGRADIADRLTASLQVDASAIQRGLGWRAELPLEDGLARMVRWYDAQDGRT